MKPWLKTSLWIVAGLAVVFVVIQFIPVGAALKSRPATNQFVWASPEAEQLAVTACYDCHSNEPKVWWGVKIAPMKWLAQSDNAQGTSALNFSAWTGEPPEQDVDRAVQSGDMPPWYYWIIHWNARLSSTQKQTLIDGYKQSLAGNKAQPIPAEVKSIISQQCKQCHSTSLALGYRASSTSKAEGLLNSMISKGAKLTDAQKQTLVDFFAGTSTQ